MHPLHEYVAKQLADKMAARGVVVWYDERAELAPFVEELRSGVGTKSGPVEVQLGGRRIHLVESPGSFFELRSAVEPLVRGDRPEPVVLYLPHTARDRRGSVLMELEKAGTTWEPQLKQLARNLLLQRFTLGVVDELLAPDRALSYHDLAGAASRDAGGEPPSVLRTIFSEQAKGLLDHDGLLAAWLASDSRDEAIAAKSAAPELVKLVRARLGLTLPADAPVVKLRAITIRYVLAGELRSDLACAPPAALDGVPLPPSKEETGAVRQLASLLRATHPDPYEHLADGVEAELGLASARLPAEALGSIDTFRFEERRLLEHAGELVAGGRFDRGAGGGRGRESTLLARSRRRPARRNGRRCVGWPSWASLAVEVEEAVARLRGDAASWVESYTDPRAAGIDSTRPNGGSKLGRESRRRARRSSPLGIARRAYDRRLPSDGDGLRARVGRGRLDGAEHSASDATSERRCAEPPETRRLLPRRRDAVRDGRRAR